MGEMRRCCNELDEYDGDDVWCIREGILALKN